MYEKQLDEIVRLAGGINEYALRELKRLVREAELNGIEKGIQIAKNTLLNDN